MNYYTLALFDFDGTITKNDSFYAFLRHFAGTIKFIPAFIYLLPTLIKYKTGIISNSKAKERVISYFFKNVLLDRFEKKCQEFAENELAKMVRPSAFEKLKWHQNEGHTVCVVSASIENYVSKWCSLYGLDCIATKLQTENNKLTGKYKGNNCYGPEKAVKIKQMYDLKSFDFIYAYGDSKGDKEMLELSTYPFYRLFK